jgi:hypothetical protein
VRGLLLIIIAGQRSFCPVVEKPEKDIPARDVLTKNYGAKTSIAD